MEICEMCKIFRNISCGWLVVPAGRLPPIDWHKVRISVPASRWLTGSASWPLIDWQKNRISVPASYWLIGSSSWPLVEWRNDQYPLAAHQPDRDRDWTASRWLSGARLSIWLFLVLDLRLSLLFCCILIICCLSWLPLAGKLWQLETSGLNMIAIAAVYWPRYLLLVSGMMPIPISVIT